MIAFVLWQSRVVRTETNGLQSLKYLLSASFWEKFANPRCILSVFLTITLQNWSKMPFLWIEKLRPTEFNIVTGITQFIYMVRV